LQKQAPPWTVAVIQGNIDQSKKWDPAFQQETLKRYQDLSDAAAAQKPRQDLLVWPETAAPFFYGVDERLSQQLDDIVRKIGEALLFGSPGVTMQNGEAQLQNRAYLLSPEAVPLGFYAKEHLVPFGEYVPLQSILFFVHHLVQAAGDFVPGHNPSPLTLGNQRFGVLICYEGIFPELARRTVLRGASSLVNITNDAWYGKTSAPYQHLEIESWRSIECRTPLIRAANTGISAIIDATGKFYGSIPLDEQGYLVATVHPFHKLTIYVKWGDFFAMICILTTVAGLLYSLQIIRRPTSRNV